MRVFSGVQPSGETNSIHLGNYLGAIKNWVKLQDNPNTECIFCVADLHAITVPQNPITLHQNIRSIAAAYIACGIDPAKSAIFRQSSVPSHSELAWVLTTQTKMGWLNRMTQFKAKSGVSEHDRIQRIIATGQRLSNALREPFPSTDENGDDDAMRLKNAIAILDEYENTQGDGIGAGLYMYPVLMAADILLYQTTHVPVGDDQLQHLQLARQIARSFNAIYPGTFVEPEGITNTTGARIMSLRYPERKMSKSNMETPEEIIFLTDTADQIMKKIKRATTDSDMLPSEPTGLVNRAGAKNLLSIYALLRDTSIEDTCSHFGGKGFGHLKKELMDAIIDTIVPIGDRMRNMTDAETMSHLNAGTAHVSKIALETMNNVYNKIGMGA